MDADHSLVVPFVVVRSHGGPYDDDAYVAGFEAGRLDARLEALSAAVSTRATIPGVDAAATVRGVFHTDNLAQIDLLAMRHGFAMAVDSDSEQVEGWVSVVLRR